MVKPSASWPLMDFTGQCWLVQRLTSFQVLLLTRVKKGREDNQQHLSLITAVVWVSAFEAVLAHRWLAINAAVTFGKVPAARRPFWSFAEIISHLLQLCPQLRRIRQRWSIENELHWARDAQLGEDAHR